MRHFDQSDTMSVGTGRPVCLRAPRWDTGGRRLHVVRRSQLVDHILGFRLAT